MAKNAPIDLSTVRLETERLILRPWQLSDLADFYEYCSVPGVGEMAGWSHHKNQEESAKILQLFIAEKKTFAMELKSSGKVIGSVGIEPLRDELGPAFSELLGREIGYVLNKVYWGQGYMPEAVQAVIDYCFNTVGCDFLACGYYLFNQQSKRVNEKLGFVYLRSLERQTRMGTTEAMDLRVLFHPELEPKPLLKETSKET